MNRIKIGYSPCPNDTYIFYALVHGKLTYEPFVSEVLADIETLNNMAMSNELDVAKVSFHAFAHLRENYCLLHAGGALGRGCGPLVISKKETEINSLQNLCVAIPGKMTTAALLLRLYDSNIEDIVVLPFDKIIEAVYRGDVDAGLIIHESRFTYQQYGLKSVLDLGEWWEDTTGHAIPLGGILIRRELGTDHIKEFDSALRASVEFAHSNFQQVRDYVCSHAQEIDDSVIQAHIDLYVNKFTLDYGSEGEAAITDLLMRAENADLIPASTHSIFVS
ncbi:MAG: 1,4-dihydroxy-6-naphthoate synthase [Candidatus Latescibacterota bacterium]|nr:1,4-dihydroxy-6-naphthoate synthase [Candidatus Latescibacterota bacterium]